MKATVFHGSPRKGNTYHATKIFMDELSKNGDVEYSEFFLPKDLLVFCTGCTLCMEGLREKCPNAEFVTPIFDAVINADALIFAAPHYGACSIPASMKTLLDHLDFLVLNVSPREEIFTKKAFIITTGAGTTAAVRPIKNLLLHWGINRVYSRGIRLFTGKWDNMSNEKRAKHERALRKSANKFYNAKKRHPHLSTIFFYHMSKFILKNYVGEGNAPYELWKEKGYFKKRPF
ncbi:MAG: NAD(P)H-dependent oxidoreductase [Oscillospiraceae bacterium]|nr:NAD(P)H-dependent oxidoreductase [Oscillospiraceae bacterium]